jgi:hypothetical protein
MGNENENVANVADRMQNMRTVIGYLLMPRASLRNRGQNHFLVVPPALRGYITFDTNGSKARHHTRDERHTRMYILMKSINSMLCMSSVTMT